MKIVRLKDKINGKEITVKVQKDMKPHDIYVSEESGEWLFNKTGKFRKLLKRFIKWLFN